MSCLNHWWWLRAEENGRVSWVDPAPEETTALWHLAGGWIMRCRAKCPTQQNHRWVTNDQSGMFTRLLDGENWPREASCVTTLRLLHGKCIEVTGFPSPFDFFLETCPWFLYYSSPPGVQPPGTSVCYMPIAATTDTTTSMNLNDIAI